MSMTLVMSWRNVWRNKRRTLITAAALGLGVLSMVFTGGLMNGLLDRMVRVATESRTGAAQIHAEGYPKTRDEALVIKDAPAVIKRVKAAPKVKEVSARVWGLGLVRIGARAKGVQLIGIQHEQERKVSNWSRRLAKGGAFLSGETNQILLGAKLADELEIEVGSRVLLTAANIHTGEATTDGFQVVGLLRTGDTAMDTGTAIISLGEAQQMMGLKDGVHELTLDLDVDREKRAFIAPYLKPLEAPGLVVRPWHDINTMISQTLGMMDAWVSFLALFIFFIIGFGIVNTISMGLIERFHEFGIMRALGTTPAQLAALVVAEAGWLALVGAIPGALIGLGLSAWMGKVGFDMTESSQYGMSFVEPIYPVPDVGVALQAVVTFTALTMLTSVFTAYRASRVKPVEAMRR